MATAQKDCHILICSHPALGHVLPMRLLAKDLLARGYPTTFSTDPTFEYTVADIPNLQFIAVKGPAAVTDQRIVDRISGKNGDSKTSLDRVNFAFEHLFASSIPGQHAAIQDFLAKTAAASPSTRVIVIHDIAFGGTLPIMLGAPGIKPAGIITIGVCPIFVTSCDTAPFGLGLAPDSSPAGKERNLGLARMAHLMYNAPAATVNKTLAALGARDTPAFFVDCTATLPDRFLQMCVPQLEYPRSDAPANLRFTGGLPRGRGEPWADPPPWWPQLAAHRAAGKRVVAVSQGSYLHDYEDLICPTMSALAGEADLLVVAVLGKAGAVLPDDFAAPANARVGGYVPFDELLQHADVFVTNGGYGGFQHALSHGCPLVFAGVGADKPEVAARGVWAGVGVNLKTDTPSEKEVRAAVLQVLGDASFKANAEGLAKEIEKWNCYDVLAENVAELLAK